MITREWVGMDEFLMGAITEVRFDDPAWVRAWFEAVCEGYDTAVAADPEVTWPGLVAAVQQRAMDAGFAVEYVDRFAGYLAGATDPVAALRELRERGDDLPDWYAHLTAAPEDEAATDQAATEETATVQAAAEQETADVSAYPELREGDSGEWVEYLDSMLRSKGF
jgi:hypothetical protein